MRVRVKLKTKKIIILLFVIMMHSDQCKPKSHLKLNKIYIFSEVEQFPLSGVMNVRVVVMMGGTAVGQKFCKLSRLRKWAGRWRIGLGYHERNGGGGGKPR